MPFYFAEDLKEKWGHADPEGEQNGEEVLLPSFQGQPRRLVRRTALCRPLIDRLQETMGLIQVRVQQAGLSRLPPGGIVLTGGTAKIPGLEQLAKTTLGCPVRIAAPMGIRGISHEQNKPSLSAVIGLLLWGIKNLDHKRVFSPVDPNAGASKTLFQRIRKAVKV